MNKKFTRREFISKSALGLGLASVDGLKESEPKSKFSDELPKRKLGRTGRMVSCIGFGGGRFWRIIRSESEAERFIEYAVKLGITYFDTAKQYGNGISEKRFGKYLTPKYRNRIFLVTKTLSRKYDEVMRDIESSLKNLNTEYLDLYLMHGIDKMSDVKTLSSASGGYKAYLKLKNERVIKHIGFSYHKWNKVSKEALERFDSDVVMCVLNAARHSGCEEYFLPIALERNIGIVAMKVTGQNALIGNVSGGNLVRYSLSLPVAVANVGMDGWGALESSAAIGRESVISKDEREKIHKELAYNPKTHKLPYFH